MRPLSGPGVDGGRQALVRDPADYIFQEDRRMGWLVHLQGKTMLELQNRKGKKVTMWNNTSSEDIIESTGHRCGRNRLHLGNVG